MVKSGDPAVAAVGRHGQIQNRKPKKTAAGKKKGGTSELTERGPEEKTPPKNSNPRNPTAGENHDGGRLVSRQRGGLTNTVHQKCPEEPNEPKREKKGSTMIYLKPRKKEKNGRQR